MNQAQVTTSISDLDVSRISAIKDRVLRNLEITHCYAQLSIAMSIRTGDMANWCTFATWASRQAGSTIRGEDLLDGIERLLGKNSSLLAPVQSFSRWLLRKGLFKPETFLGQIINQIHTPFDAFERASEQVAKGNLKVFEEIGFEFARFLQTVPADSLPDSAEMELFSAGLRPGPPPEGQQYLKQAFTHYQQQVHETDPAFRAGWILLANLKIGLHEQTRLQPQIAAAVDAPVTTAEDLGERLLRQLFPRSKHLPVPIFKPVITVIHWLAKKLQTVAVRLTRDVVTESLMVLTLPDNVLALGKNLSAPVPDVLKNPLPSEVSDFINNYDLCPPGVSACGADDWCELPQRMHYILHLFRAYAIENSLFNAPFTALQVETFKRGVVPDGDL